ncbi:MAG TPA: RNA 2',3'-cyclic phosphodiesterase [Candidatus Acidoferrales bacterium]|nr:RNA 2',3'-cyclic phosphodiesterase [Candidatus Acidoferrales bacterium]
MRLFVALDVPEGTRQALAALIRKLEGTCRGARWVRAENLHITLKFIGEVEEARLSAIKTCLSQLNPRDTFEIQFHCFGFFPDERRPRVFWVGMESGPSMAELAAEIDSHLQPMGVPHEEKVFRPHLTLARFNTLDGLSKLREVVSNLAGQEFGETTAHEIHLYQSVLKRGGAEYTRLATFPFARGRE